MELREYDITISEDALSMLDTHAKFLAKVSPNAAKKLIDQVLADIDSLSTLPERCPFYNNSFVPGDRYRMLISCKRYLIVYEVSCGNVFVDYIIDCRQDKTKV